MKKRIPETREDTKEERSTSSTTMYSAEEVERLRKTYEAKLTALESKIQVIEKAVLSKSPEGALLHTPVPHSLSSSLENSTPAQLLELFESTLKGGSNKQDFRILTSAWGVLFSSLFLSSMEVQSEIHKLSTENQAMLREVVKVDCARGGKFVFNVIKKGGNIDRSALIMIADFQDLAGIKQDGVPAIHLLTKACDKNIRPLLIEKAGKYLLSEVFDSDGLPVLFIILSLGTLNIYDIDAIEKVFSKEDLRQVMVQNKTGRNALEAFTEISTQMREILALQHKAFENAQPEVPAPGERIAGTPENLPLPDEQGMPVDKKTKSPVQPGSGSTPIVREKDASPKVKPGDAMNKNIAILIVDDSGLIRRLLPKQLLDLGYKNYVLAKSGDEAVKIAEETKPYLVFMDINMPGKLDGIAVAKEIRKRSDARIIFITSRSDKNTLDRAKEVDPDGYILKPFTETNIRVALTLLE
ncbi:MAG: response regulator [Methanoregula sp.]